MKVRILCKQENYEKYKDMLEKSGFEISNEGNILFKEDDFKQDTFICQKDGSFEIIHYSKIIYVESFGREIVLHTANTSYSIREKLYEVEGLLSDKGCTRISKSIIVSRSGISKMKPMLNGRMDLLMKNGKTISVSRSYNKKFKDFIGF